MSLPLGVAQLVDAPDLCDRDAIWLRNELGAGRVSAVDLVESCITRIKALNPILNAVVTPDFDNARDAARRADRLCLSGGDLPRLHGLPVLIKDLTETAGLRTTYGSLCFADHIPDNDAEITRRLRHAGAIVLGKTNTPEFGAGANTRNDIFGATPNPHDLSKTAGGSSGGSAVALACGMAPLATGSDLGGSLRIPASFCGVVGMRPSAGRVPSLSNVIGYSPLWTDGPMARNVADCALMLRAIEGHVPGDPLSAPIPARNNDAFDETSLRIGYSTDFGFAPVSGAIRALFKNKVAALNGLTSIDLDLSQMADVFRILRAEAFAAGFADLVAQHGDRIGPNTRGNLAIADHYSLHDMARARVIQTDLFRQFQDVFNKVDVLLAPATAVSPFPLSMDFPADIDGAHLAEYYDWYAVTWALSPLGCPIVTIPAGRDHAGLPFGIQVIGPRHSDERVLQIAGQLAQML